MAKVGVFNIIFVKRAPWPTVLLACWFQHYISCICKYNKIISKINSSLKFVNRFWQNTIQWKCMYPYTKQPSFLIFYLINHGGYIKEHIFSFGVKWQTLVYLNKTKRKTCSEIHTMSMCRLVRVLHTACECKLINTISNKKLNWFNHANRQSKFPLNLKHVLYLLKIWESRVH